MNDPMRWSPQQTVKLAIDCESGEVIPADALLTMPETEFTALRRDAMEARVSRRRGADAVRFQCAVCRRPLYLSRHIKGRMNRWFVHDGAADDCPWSEGQRLSSEQVKALIYRGQQEGRQHRALKEFLANWLDRDRMVSEVSREQTTFSAVVRGEWRRPDVKCRYHGMTLVFEIQLSYTFLSEVIARDEFYRREGIFIVWVFSEFDRSRAAVTDEAFFNRRNLFVLDQRALQRTQDRGALTFSGFRQVPTWDGEQWRDIWEAVSIGLQDVTFPTDTYRPYFYDYDAEHQRLDQERLAAQREEEGRTWAALVESYRTAALRYYESDYADARQAELLAIVDQLEEHPAWHRGFEPLRGTQFYGYHGILAVLMSIRHGRSIGYSPKFSVYQVMEAGLRSGSRTKQHAFAIPYLWAYKIYRPAVTEKHQQWLRNYGHRVKASLDHGDPEYFRETAYDETIGLLFPELEDNLATSFGTDMMGDDGEVA